MVKIEKVENETIEPQIFEFQGQFENIELFDGKFDPISLRMTFKDFYLEGRKVQKKLTILENNRGEQKVKLIGKVQDVILFDKPARYIVSIEQLSNKKRFN